MSPDLLDTNLVIPTSTDTKQSTNLYNRSDTLNEARKQPNSFHQGRYYSWLPSPRVATLLYYTGLLLQSAAALDCHFH